MSRSGKLHWLVQRPLVRWMTVGVALAAAVATSFVITNHRIFPYYQLDRAEKIARSVIVTLVPALDDEDPGPMPVASNLLDLSFVSVEVPVDRDGYGGSLTSVGDELVVLTHEGGIWLADRDRVRRTEITPPPNGFDDYVTFAAETNLRHRLDRFRYNDILYYSDSGQRGLLVSYTEWLDDEQCYVSAVAELELPPQFESILDVSAVADDWRTLFRTHPCLPLKDRYRAMEGHMAGGRLAYLGESRILLTVGDYSWDGFYADAVLAQDDANDYGKIITIDLATGAARVLSKGHRNPQGIFVDDTGSIWSTEHGPEGGDELNRIVEGGNYGWPLETYGTAYNGTPHPVAVDYGRHTRFVHPVYAWVPSVGLSNLTGITDFHPAWDGDLLAASLTGNSLFRLRLRDGSVIFAEPIRIGERIRYVHMHGAGNIVMWTDDHELLFMSVAEQNTQSSINDFLYLESDLTKNERPAVVSVIDQCSECHSFDSVGHELAPGLGNVFGQRIGSTDFQAYSSAMANQHGTWTEDRLLRFLEDPQTVVPGTSMPDPSIESARARFAIVELLQALALQERVAGP